MNTHTGAQTAVKEATTLDSVQALRALAACMVLAFHAVAMLDHNGHYALGIDAPGAGGVDLFFVVSGFIMVYTNHEAFGRPGAPAAFLMRRAARILPLYWLCTSAIVLLLALAPGLFSTVRIDWPHVLASYAFILSKNSVGEIGTVPQTGWSLCFEVYFYLLFAALLCLPRKAFFAAFACAFAVGIGLGAIAAPVPAWVRVATSPILLEFVLGAGIALLYVGGKRLPRTLAVVAVVLGLAAILTPRGVDMMSWSRVAFWGLPGASLLAGAISLERAGLAVPRAVVALGDSSYSLYLIHLFVLPATGKLWFALQLTEKASPALLFLIACAISLVAAHALYLAFERPVTTRLARAWNPAPHRRAAQI